MSSLALFPYEMRCFFQIYKLELICIQTGHRLQPIAFYTGLPQELFHIFKKLQKNFNSDHIIIHRDFSICYLVFYGKYLQIFDLDKYSMILFYNNLQAESHFIIIIFSFLNDNIFVFFLFIGQNINQYSMIRVMQYSSVDSASFLCNWIHAHKTVHNSY